MKRKIKLRDMTREQWDKNINSLCNLYKGKNCDSCIFELMNCTPSSVRNSWINHQEMFSNKILDMEVEIETPDILDEAEKRYLRAVIRPFRNKVIYIRKYFYALSDVYSIEIYMKSVEGIFNTEYLRLPLFKNEMYKGMEDNKKYTLKELDL